MTLCRMFEPIPHDLFNREIIPFMSLKQRFTIFKKGISVTLEELLGDNQLGLLSDGEMKRLRIKCGGCFWCRFKEGKDSNEHDDAITNNLRKILSLRNHEMRKIFRALSFHFDPLNLDNRSTREERACVLICVGAQFDDDQIINVLWRIRVDDSDYANFALRDILYDSIVLDKRNIPSKLDRYPEGRKRECILIDATLFRLRYFPNNYAVFDAWTKLLFDFWYCFLHASIEKILLEAPIGLIEFIHNSSDYFTCYMLISRSYGDFRNTIRQEIRDVIENKHVFQTYMIFLILCTEQHQFEVPLCSKQSSLPFKRK